MPGRDDGGLGSQLVGDRITVNHRTVQVTKLLGEGGFSYVYLVKEMSSVDGSSGGTLSPHSPSVADHTASTSTTVSPSPRSNGSSSKHTPLVLKITSIHSRQQRSIAEKEAKLLSRLSHPSIVKMYDTCYRSLSHTEGGLLFGKSKQQQQDLSGGLAGSGTSAASGMAKNERTQHLILMEFCEGGHALDVCNKLRESKQQFDLSSLIIAFGQICNAVSYLHAQRPPIVHRDLKPVNFLVKNGAYKLCDFGSAVFGHVELKTQQQRLDAEEVIQKTTTQMFRAPEMVDLHMGKKLTQGTDVWALGCCLYSLAYLQNCFEEGSNLAILSRNFKIPESNQYGSGLVELIDRMLTVDPKARADMTEVILCLSAIYSGKPLPKRKVPKVKKSSPGEPTETTLGAYRTDGQGIRTSKPQVETKKPVEARKLNPNSAAARRRRAAAQTSSGSEGTSQNSRSFPESPLAKVQFHGSFKKFDSLNTPTTSKTSSSTDDDMAFSASGNPFADIKADQSGDSQDAILGSFHQAGEAEAGSTWEQAQTFPTFSPDEDSALMALNAVARSTSSDGDGLERLSIRTADSEGTPKERRRRAKAK